MADPAADLAAYAMIEAEVAGMLGIDLSGDVDQMTRLRLGRGTALRIEIGRYDHAQREGQPIDVGARNRASELLEAMLAPAGSQSGYDLKLLSDPEHTMLTWLLAKASGRAPYDIATDPDPAAIELMRRATAAGTTTENLTKTTAALRRATATHELQRKELIGRQRRIEELELEVGQLREETVRLSRACDLQDELLRTYRPHVPPSVLDKPIVPKPTNVMPIR